MSDRGQEQAFFTWTPQAQLTVGPAGLIVAWNPAATQLTGIPADAAVGRPLANVIPRVASGLDAGSRQPLNPPTPERHDLSILRSDGAQIPVTMTVVHLAASTLVMLDDRRPLEAAKRRLAELQDRTTRVLDAVPVAVVVVCLRDDQFEVLYQNARGAESYGWADEEWERDPDFTLKIVHPDDQERMAAFQEDVRRSKASYDVEYRVVRPDGSVLWVRDMATTVYDPDGAPGYWIGCIVDVSEQKTTELALRTALDDLATTHATVQTLSRQKSDYLSQVSHEFRTPLTSIQGYSELIATEDLAPADIRRFATIIDRSAQRLSRLINDLLDLDRIESGRVQASRQALRLERTVSEVVELLRGASHQHTVTVRVASALPVVHADAELMTQLVINLLGNAVKYTPAGSTIEVCLAETSDARVRLMVTDNGPGIPAADLEGIFSRFARLERDNLSGTTGTGLGLAIVHHIVAMHDGRVWAENVAGGGARFVVELPVGDPPKPATGRAMHDT